jgi:hypothetical protein
MKRRATIIVSVALTLMAVAAWLLGHTRHPFDPGADRLILLVPDGTDFSDPRVTVWLDAASEEGLHVVPMSDSSFLRPLFGKPQCAGVILPDSVHQQASDLLLSAIREYVATGGNLMLVYDAGTKSLQGLYPGDRSRLSDLAGVDYAFYRVLRDKTTQSADVSGAISVMDDLGVPPGKYFPFSSSTSKYGAFGKDIAVPLRRYHYGNLEYPSFVTSGTYTGQVLLRSSAGIVAGYHPYQKGSVLFVNLPLGYLKSQTDGLLLHAFLKYFAAKVLSLPYLTSVPDGVGGLVLDWHVDSNASIKALQEMSTWTIFQQGPYSIDITAGPDTYVPGDNKGFNVLHNPVSQDLVHEYVRLGEEIGSHGGWIHNYFAAHVDTDNPKDLEKLLELNKAALEQVTGKTVAEYSAPNGNQPEWVTHWLESHGFVAYYFTGDTGMGPTRGYRGGRRAGQNIWAFPIVHMDRAASFEEMSGEDVSYGVIEQWLEALTDFVARQEQVRLIYFHPPGILSFRQVVDNWLEKTAQLKAQGRFRWYTMTEMANFLNSRKRVMWKLSERGERAFLEAAGPQTLAHQAWRFPASRFGKPEVARGSATILKDSGGWLVVAGDDRQLEVEAGILSK